jgi:hypothetical protein
VTLWQTVVGHIKPCKVTNLTILKYPNIYAPFDTLWSSHPPLIKHEWHINYMRLSQHLSVSLWICTRYTLVCCHMVSWSDDHMWMLCVFTPRWQKTPMRTPWGIQLCYQGVCVTIGEVRGPNLLYLFDWLARLSSRMCDAGVIASCIICWRRVEWLKRIFPFLSYMNCSCCWLESPCYYYYGCYSCYYFCYYYLGRLLLLGGS